MLLSLAAAASRIVVILRLCSLLIMAAAVGQDPVASPGEPAGKSPPELTQTELQSLNELARSWLRSDLRYHNAATPVELKARAPKRIAAKAAFAEAMARFDATRSQPLLLDAKALRQTFANTLFPEEAPATVGSTTFVTDENRVRAEFVPAAYDHASSHATILVLADRDARSSQATLQNYLESTWLAAETGEEPILIAPMAPADDDFDVIEEKPNTLGAEQARIGAAFVPLGAALRKLHVDRDRMILDCGRGASAFGLRLAANFPDRFAAVILRWPVLEEGVRLEALAGLPVLLLRCAATEAACDRLRTRLNEHSEGSCHVLTPRGDYPFVGEVGIVEWARQQRRDVMAAKVVVAPSVDRFCQNRWLRMDVADAVDPANPDDGPRLRAEVDRERNRITVATRGVQEFSLLLGPELVDVRKFTLVVDGREQVVTEEPSLTMLFAHITNRFDAGWLFTAKFRVSVP